MSASEKLCRPCGRVQSLDHFYNSNKLKSGKDSICIECRARNKRRYYKVHREEILSKVKLSQKKIRTRKRSRSTGYRVSVDFVVAQRIMDSWVSHVYISKHSKASSGSAWVAYCTVVAKFGPDFVPWFGGSWFKDIKARGEECGWPFLTVDDVIARLDSDEYVNNKLLEDWSVDV